MYDPTKVKVDYGHVRREKPSETFFRNVVMEVHNPKVRALIRKHSKMDDAVNTYERARRAGQVTYYELGRKSRRA
jgi:hypothetical protein